MLQISDKYYDVFNGDADGLCALHQWRLAEPQPDAQLVTGVKRDIRLLERLVGVEHADITVFDISLDSNRQPLAHLLRHNRVRYFDHHYAGELPASPQLETHIFPDPETCTALIVDRLLHGRFRNWAITGAFGDNLHEAAARAAAATALTAQEIAALRELGELLNYNGYGKSVTDLYFHPADLYNALKDYPDPLAFCRFSPELPKLRQGFAADMANGRQIPPFRENVRGRIYRFPAAPWSRRVAGVLMNEKAREAAELAHVLLIDNGDNTSLASIRAPLNNRHGADKLARAFPTGGGRPAAAGINALPNEMLPEFLTAFDEVFR
jgi:hypothetical protein